MNKSERLARHSMLYGGIYCSWYAMKQRCGNPNNKQYKDYGGRGITYPSKWETITGFKDDMADGYQKGLTLDRIDNNKGYAKENCRCATRKEQNNNKRNHILLIDYRGQKITLAQYAELFGLNFDTLRSRYYRGMTPEEILEVNLYRPAKLLK